MGQRNSFAALFTDAQTLLLAIDANAEQLPGVAQAKVGLEQSLGEVRDISTRRKTLTAEKQALSQQLRDAVGRTQERASELRSLLRFMLGMRNEKLVEFNVPPARLGTRRTSKGTGETVTPTPAVLAALAPAANPPVASDVPSNS
jgi:hypothetical protein